MNNLEPWAIEPDGIRNMATGQFMGADPEPEAPRMLIGAHINPDDLSNWNRLVGILGPMNIVRSYSPNLPSSWLSTTAAWHPSNVTSWHSVKASWGNLANGDYDATITSFVNSIPDKSVWLTLAHEPENDGGVASQWRAAQSHFYDLVKSLRPDIKVGPILMNWTFNPSSGRNPADWTPAVNKMDFFGLDPYNTHNMAAWGYPTSWQWPTEVDGLQAFFSYVEGLGVPPAIGEVGCADWYQGNQPWRKAQWMTEFCDLVYDHGCLAVCWFHTDKFDVHPSILLDYTPESIAAWSGVINKYVGS